MHTQADKHTQKKVNLMAELFLAGQQHLGSVGHGPASSLMTRLRHMVSCHRSSRHCQGWARTHTHTHKVICFSRGAVTEQLQVKGTTSTLHHTEQSTPRPVLHWPANPEVSNEVLLLLIMHTSRCCTFPYFSLTLSLSPSLSLSFSSFPDGASVIKLMTSLAVLRSNYWKKSHTSK